MLQSIFHMHGGLMNKNNNQSWQSWSKTSIIILTLLFWVTVFTFLSSNASAASVNVEIGAQTRSAVPDGNQGSYEKWGTSATYLKTYIEVPAGAIGQDVKLYMRSFGSTGSYYINSYSTSSFSENVVTWNNAPAEIDLLSEWYGSVSTNQWFYITIPSVTQYIVLTEPGTPRGLDIYSDDTGSIPYMVYEIPASSINFNPNVPISNQTQQYFDYMVNDTYEDYMYFVTSVWHAPYNLPDLYLIENWLNVEQEGENIQLNNPFSDLQTYHLNLYATTSAPPVVSESFLIASSDEIYINRSYARYIPPIPDPEPEPDPYDPDPNPIEDPDIPIPDDWNMTIPDKYQNVSWLTNYTGYFDDMRYSINGSLYGVTGLVIEPLQSLNETVHVLRYHISNSTNMVAEYSYLSVIVYYGWGALPVEMQTIFVGIAAAGACIYLFKRRT